MSLQLIHLGPYPIGQSPPDIFGAVCITLPSPLSIEAGAGKASVIREFLGHAAGRPVVLHGVCDPLAVPRPLGPLIDAAGDVDPAAAQRLGAGISRVEAFAIAQSLIDGTYSAGRTTAFVIEDLHWADYATLDLLTFLGRRVLHVATLLLGRPEKRWNTSGPRSRCSPSPFRSIWTSYRSHRHPNPTMCIVHIAWRQVQ